MKRKNRKLVIILSIVGLFLLLNEWISFLTIAALLFLFWGVRRFRQHDPRRGYVLVFVGAILFVMDNFFMVIGMLSIAIGLFLLRSHPVPTGRTAVEKRNLYTVLKRYFEPWFLQDIRLRHVIGDVDLDLSLAIPEQHENIIVLEGVLGDVKILIPEEMGVHVEAEVLLGRININGDADPGVLEKIVWQSPHYHRKEYKVKLFISYIVGDIDVHTV